MPSFSSTPASSTDPTVGALLCASGSQKCNGHIGTLAPKPDEEERAITHLGRRGRSRPRASRRATRSNVPVFAWSSRKPSSISAEPITVTTRKRVAARRRPTGSCSSPQSAMTNHIGISTSSKKTKNRIRSSAAKVPMLRRLDHQHQRDQPGPEPAVGRAAEQRHQAAPGQQGRQHDQRRRERIDARGASARRAPRSSVASVLDHVSRRRTASSRPTARPTATSVTDAIADRRRRVHRQLVAAEPAPARRPHRAAAARPAARGHPISLATDPDEHRRPRRRPPTDDGGEVALQRCRCAVQRTSRDAPLRCRCRRRAA